MRRIGAAERRARLGRRQFLAGPAPDVEHAAGAVAGLHSSDPATVYLSAWARVAGFAPAHLEAALYEHKTLVRMHGMRRTMFVLPVADGAVMDAACTQTYAAVERRRLAGLLETQGIAADGEAWIAGVAAATLDCLRDLGEATGSELREHVPELTETIDYATGKSYAATLAVTTRILFQLAAEGRIVRGRPRGTWLSSQYRWAPMDAWIGGGLPQVDAGTAPAALLQRWLACYGPGTFSDLKWWTGWTVSRTREALAGADAVEVELDDGAGYVLAADLEPVAETEPWAALLPSLDVAVMGWKERDWIVGPHAGPLFDRNGNAGPAVWVNGRVVGGWAQGPDAGVRLRLLEDVSTEAQSRIEAKAHELTAWLAGTRVTPRFATPLTRELMS